MVRRSLHLICAPGTRADDYAMAMEGIQTLLSLGRLEQIVEIRSLGVWREAGHVREGRLQAWLSVDWYVATGRQHSSRANQVHAGVIVDLLQQEPWQQREPHYDVLLLPDDMYEDGVNFLLGDALPGENCVISPFRLQGLPTDQRLACLKTVVMHELGHVFGLVPVDRKTNIDHVLGLHCRNVCLMRQGLFVPDDWLRFTTDRLVGPPLCPECLNDLQRFGRVHR